MAKHFKEKGLKSLVQIETYKRRKKTQKIPLKKIEIVQKRGIFKKDGICLKLLDRILLKLELHDYALNLDAIKVLTTTDYI
jgi:hypothetical protein